MEQSASEENCFERGKLEDLILSCVIINTSPDRGS